MASSERFLELMGLKNREEVGSGRHISPLEGGGQRSPSETMCPKKPSDQEGLLEGM
jgi:hypothetical protein